MLVPRHWAEARRSLRVDGRAVTVRRFGWSSASEAEATAHAEHRAAEAAAAIEAGQAVEPRERKFPYNGADGLPIREEILEEDEDGRFVVTRNSYGAHCLNAPSLLIADVDFDAPSPSAVVSCLLAIGCWALAATALASTGSAVPSAVAFGLIVGAVLWLAVLALYDSVARLFGDPSTRAGRRLMRFVRSRPDWRVRAYRTPRGLRLIAVHRLFDPVDDLPVIERFFRAVRADSTYARMCRLQRCFRARLTPKPWRIGIDDHLRPRPGVWPVDPARRAVRDAWVARYEAAREGYAACVFINDVGDGREDPDALEITRAHDERAGALTDRPIA